MTTKRHPQSESLPHPHNLSELEIRSHIEELKLRKGICSRTIGDAKKAGKPVDALIETMREITTSIAEFTSALHDLPSKSKPDETRDVEADQLSTRPSAYPSESHSHQDEELEYIELVGDASAALRVKWDEYVANHPRARFAHRFAIATTIAQISGHSTARFACLSDGTIRGILTVGHLKSRLFGDFRIALPYLNYGGVLGDNPHIELTLMRTAAKACLTSGSRHIEIRNETEHPGLAVRKDKVTMKLALPGSSEILFHALKSKVRAQIRRADRESLACNIGGVELLDDFYAVFAENMRDLGTPVYSRSFFEQMFQVSPRDSRIVVVYRGDAPIACAFLHGHNKMLEIPWASSLRRFNALGSNMWMYWQVLQYAIERGYSSFDFGRCTRESSTWKFKKQWGAQEHQLYWHYLYPESSAQEEPPKLNPDNPKFALMIAVWRRLPVPVANLLGPMIVRHLP